MLLSDEAATEALGHALAQALPQQRAAPLVLYLAGELGAGKTTLARGLLRALGVTGTIRSPSFTLVEPYETPTVSVLHADLYRLRSAAEVAELGLGELDSHSLLLVEWPERGDGCLAPPDLIVHLSHAQAGRTARMEARTAAGRRWLEGKNIVKESSVSC
jgi:tRNA threonylcarbamoyl adenosine modification protein YjeE